MFRANYLTKFKYSMDNVLPNPVNAGVLVAGAAPKAGVVVAPNPVVGLAPKMLVPSD